MRMPDFSLGVGERVEGGSGWNRNVACLSDSQGITDSVSIRIEDYTDARGGTWNCKVKSFKSQFCHILSLEKQYSLVSFTCVPHLIKYDVMRSCTRKYLAWAYYKKVLIKINQITLIHLNRGPFSASSEDIKRQKHLYSHRRELFHITECPYATHIISALLKMFTDNKGGNPFLT